MATAWDRVVVAATGDARNEQQQYAMGFAFVFYPLICRLLSLAPAEI